MFVIFLRPYCFGIYLKTVILNNSLAGIKPVIKSSLSFSKDEPLRKHLPRMFSLIKNESKGDRRRTDNVVVLKGHIQTPRSWTSNVRNFPDFFYGGIVLELV